LEEKVVRRAAAVTSASSGVAIAIVKRHPGSLKKVHVIRNGYDSVPITPAYRTGHRLSILFAGELYVGRDPFPFLSSLETLLARTEVDASRISAIFMGRASSYAGRSLEAWVKDRRCSAVVKLLPQLPQEAVTEAVQVSTVLLNLSQGQRLSIPAKTFEHLTAGREMLLLCENDCETAELVSGLQGVVQVDPRNTSKLDEALLDLYRRHVINGRLEAPSGDDLARFSREAGNEKMLSVVQDLITVP
jgi:hypothetical protein